MALMLSPEAPLDQWLVSLDSQIARAPTFFDGRPVLIDCGALPANTPDVAGFLRKLEQRGIRIIGTEGAHPTWAGVEAWGRPMPASGNAGRPIEVPDEPKPLPTQAGQATSLTLADPVRSGQSVIFEHGDVSVVGSVASGAEVMAGGSVHVYGPLLGRAVAGLAGNNKARIFCGKLQAELLAIDGVYMTAEHMPAELIGRPVQAWLENDTMKLAALDGATERKRTWRKSWS